MTGGPAPARVVVRFDGGSRGNPGPAAGAALVEGPEGTVLARVGERIGEATNNVAEYRALLLGLEEALGMGAQEVEVVGDSELVIRQLTGVYRVKQEPLKELHREALAKLGAFKRWTARSVPRAENKATDTLVNRLLDGKGADG